MTGGTRAPDDGSTARAFAHHALTFTLVAALALAGCKDSAPQRPRAPAAAHRRPNVVLLIMDTLRADALGSYGGPAGPGRELDRRARQGVRFEHVLAQCSWTRPSIGSMLTSRHPRTLGLYRQQGDMLPGEFETLAEALKQAGYSTIGVTANPNIDAYFGFAQGFDKYRDSVEPFSWMPDANIPTHGKLTRGMRRTARQVYAEALDLAREAGGDRPLYLQLNVMEVHTGHLVQPEFLRAVRAVPWFGPPHRRYLAGLRQLSVYTDAFIRATASLPGGRDTLFVLTSDHGEGLVDHPAVANSNTHGEVLYESNLRVPLILYHSGGKLRPGVVHQTATLLELMPTVLDLVEVPGPDRMQGSSFAPYITGAGPPPPAEFVFAETRFVGHDKRAVHDRRWGYYTAARPQKGMRRRELQPPGHEDGERTDRLAAHGSCRLMVGG